MIHHSSFFAALLATLSHARAGPRHRRVLTLRAVLGLLHGDLVNMGQRLGTRCTFDGLYRDVLHLLLGFTQLLFETGDLRRLP